MAQKGLEAGRRSGSDCYETRRRLVRGRSTPSWRSDRPHPFTFDKTQRDGSPEEKIDHGKSLQRKEDYHETVGTLKYVSEMHTGRVAEPIEAGHHRDDTGPGAFRHASVLIRFLGAIVLMGVRTLVGRQSCNLSARFSRPVAAKE